MFDACRANSTNQHPLAEIDFMGPIRKTGRLPTGRRGLKPNSVSDDQTLALAVTAESKHDAGRVTLDEITSSWFNQV